MSRYSKKPVALSEFFGASPVPHVEPHAELESELKILQILGGSFKPLLEEIKKANAANQNARIACVMFLDRILDPAMHALFELRGSLSASQKAAGRDVDLFFHGDLETLLEFLQSVGIWCIHVPLCNLIRFAWRPDPRSPPVDFDIVVFHESIGKPIEGGGLLVKEYNRQIESMSRLELPRIRKADETITALLKHLLQTLYNDVPVDGQRNPVEKEYLSMRMQAIHAFVRFTVLQGVNLPSFVAAFIAFAACPTNTKNGREPFAWTFDRLKTMLYILFGDVTFEDVEACGKNVYAHVTMDWASKCRFISRHIFSNEGTQHRTPLELLYAITTPHQRATIESSKKAIMESVLQFLGPFELHVECDKMCTREMVGAVTPSTVFYIHSIHVMHRLFARDPFFLENMRKTLFGDPMRLGWFLACVLKVIEQNPRFAVNETDNTNAREAYALRVCVRYFAGGPAEDAATGFKYMNSVQRVASLDLASVKPEIQHRNPMGSPGKWRIAINETAYYVYSCHIHHRDPPFTDPDQFTAQLILGTLEGEQPVDPPRSENYARGMNPASSRGARSSNPRRDPRHGANPPR